MSTTPPTATLPPRSPSSAAGYLVVFAIGLLVGVVLIVVMLRTFDARKTWQDRYPAALMQLYRAQMAQLSGDLDSNRCALSDALPHLQTMRALSNDLEPAFPDLRDHRGFVAHAANARRTLDAALATPPADCASLRITIDAIGETCGACHQDMRG
ncbi:hypothetical protein [Luteimonas fraxinea]|uniref:hypothetical protein n=1 Tax=Luteimonas fraxinea TaxID=2901869 RepID=UPI001E2DB97D|nr:hypothetical protein [Luteimonas fraxinea]MCD9126813.1 hypothetical protein [Luteimonas fraxinea]